jgi:hypothetical protein
MEVVHQRLRRLHHQVAKGRIKRFLEPRCRQPGKADPPMRPSALPTQMRATRDHFPPGIFFAILTGKISPRVTLQDRVASDPMRHELRQQ